MANSLLCTKCGNWVLGRRARIKRDTTKLATRFVCSRCREMTEGTADSMRKLFDETETVNEFRYLGDNLNASGGCEAAVTERVKIS